MKIFLCTYILHSSIEPWNYLGWKRPVMSIRQGAVGMNRGGGSSTLNSGKLQSAGEEPQIPWMTKVLLLSRGTQDPHGSRTLGLAC